MGAGFHSVGRGTPDKQVTDLDGTAGLPSALAVVVPSPPAGIARVIGNTEAGFVTDMSTVSKLFNPTAAALNVDFFIDGPDGTNLITSAVGLAAGARNDDVLNDQIVIEQGETIQAQIPASSTGDEARVIANWVDFRMDDVLKLNRLVVASGQAFADLIPAPPLGSRHVGLGGHDGPASGASAGEGGAIQAMQLLDNGVPTPLGSVTLPADSYNSLDSIDLALDPGQSLQLDGEAGTGVYYVAFLKVPSNP